MSDIKGKVCLNQQDKEDIVLRLGVIPRKVNGLPFCKIVRRKVFDRKRITVLRAEHDAPNQGENQDLWRLCKYRPSIGLETVGWALRSKLNGDYYVFSESLIWED
jgi:hypothetical protein